MSGPATADSEHALQSLDALVQTGPGTVLPGHGKVWRDGVESAVAQARRNGPA